MGLFVIAILILLGSFAKTVVELAAGQFLAWKARNESIAGQSWRYDVRDVQLPEVNPIPQKLFKPSSRQASLVVPDAAKVSGKQDIRKYKEAMGYYTGAGNAFCVLKGSTASGETSPSFEQSQGGYAKERIRLIEQGILKRERTWDNYLFTKDHVFKSPSAAACIVSGYSRNGRDCWGKESRT